MVLEGVKEMWTELPKSGKGKTHNTWLMAFIHVINFREEKGQAGQQGQIHLQDVPQGRLCHPGVEESPGGCWSLGVTPPASMDVWMFYTCDYQFTNSNGTFFFVKA